MTTEVKAAKKRVPAPGTKSLHVTVSEALHKLLEETADGRPINVWLSKLIERHVPNSPELGAK